MSDLYATIETPQGKYEQPLGLYVFPLHSIVTYSILHVVLIASRS